MTTANPKASDFATIDQRDGKYAMHVGMIRLVRALADRLDEHGLLFDGDGDQINNVVYGFLDELPKKVFDSIREG